MNEKIHLALLHKIWLNHKKLHIIFEGNTNYKDFYDNLSSNTLFTYGFSPKQIEFILENKNKYNIADIKKKLEQREVGIITINDKNYPELLKQIPNPPFLFYLRWYIDNSPKIAVVWTRKMSSYWEKAILNIVWEISEYFEIISWWAAWCDTYSHKVCLDKNKKTISVIWTWIDIDYPVSNKDLYNKIVLSWWWIVSIFPIWEVWNSYNFPVRNEIVAWLSNWVLVVESQIKSWTLITANLALDLWKDLYAVPWDIFKTTSEWCNMLIKKWMAKLVNISQDVLEEYNISKSFKKILIDFSDELEKLIYNTLLIENLTIDELSLKLWLNISELSFKLSMMEIKKIIKKSFWWKYEVF